MIQAEQVKWVSFRFFLLFGVPLHIPFRRSIPFHVAGVLHLRFSIDFARDFELLDPPCYSVVQIEPKSFQAFEWAVKSGSPATSIKVRKLCRY